LTDIAGENADGGWSSGGAAGPLGSSGGGGGCYGTVAAKEGAWMSRNTPHPLKEDWTTPRSCEDI